MNDKVQLRVIPKPEVEQVSSVRPVAKRARLCGLCESHTGRGDMKNQRCFVDPDHPAPRGYSAPGCTAWRMAEDADLGSSPNLKPHVMSYVAVRTLKSGAIVRIDTVIVVECETYLEAKELAGQALETVQAFCQEKE